MALTGAERAVRVSVPNANLKPEFFVACRRPQKSLEGNIGELRNSRETLGRSVIISQAFSDEAAFRYSVLISLFIHSSGRVSGHWCPHVLAQ